MKRAQRINSLGAQFCSCCCSFWELSVRSCSCLAWMIFYRRIERSHTERNSERMCVECRVRSPFFCCWKTSCPLSGPKQRLLHPHHLWGGGEAIAMAGGMLSAIMSPPHTKEVAQRESDSVSLLQ